MIYRIILLFSFISCSEMYASAHSDNDGDDVSVSSTSSTIPDDKADYFNSRSPNEALGDTIATIKQECKDTGAILSADQVVRLAHRFKVVLACYANSDRNDEPFSDFYAGTFFENSECLRQANTMVVQAIKDGLAKDSTLPWQKFLLGVRDSLLDFIEDARAQEDFEYMIRFGVDHFIPMIAEANSDYDIIYLSYTYSYMTRSCTSPILKGLKITPEIATKFTGAMHFCNFLNGKDYREFLPKSGCYTSSLANLIQIAKATNSTGADILIHYALKLRKYDGLAINARPEDCFHSTLGAYCLEIACGEKIFEFYRLSSFTSLSDDGKADFRDILKESLAPHDHSAHTWKEHSPLIIYLMSFAYLDANIKIKAMAIEFTKKFPKWGELVKEWMPILERIDGNLARAYKTFFSQWKKNFNPDVKRQYEISMNLDKPEPAAEPKLELAAKADDVAESTKKKKRKKKKKKAAAAAAASAADVAEEISCSDDPDDFFVIEDDI